MEACCYKVKGCDRDALLNFIFPLVVHAVVNIILPRHFDVLGRHFGHTNHLLKIKRAPESAPGNSVTPWTTFHDIPAARLVGGCMKATAALVHLKQACQTVRARPAALITSRPSGQPDILLIYGASVYQPNESGNMLLTCARAPVPSTRYDVYTGRR